MGTLNIYGGIRNMCLEFARHADAVIHLLQAIRNADHNTEAMNIAIIAAWQNYDHTWFGYHDPLEEPLSPEQWQQQEETFLQQWNEANIVELEDLPEVVNDSSRHSDLNYLERVAMEYLSILNNELECSINCIILKMRRLSEADRSDDLLLPPLLVTEQWDSLFEALAEVKALSLEYIEQLYAVLALAQGIRSMFRNAGPFPDDDGSISMARSICNATWSSICMRQANRSQKQKQREANFMQQLEICRGQSRNG
jgi:hypothetical protein